MSNWILPWSGRSVNYTENDIRAVVEVMEIGDPQTQGLYQERFEKAFSDYLGGRHCFAVNSCASALELAAALIRLKPNDEVIIPAHTYCATAIPFARRKAKIRWADIDPTCFCATANEIEPLITPKTKAIVIVHLYGVNVPMRPVMELAEKHGLFVIEDCAQSLGATYEGRKSGWHGDIACFSFHGQKNITTLGEGGMIAVKSADMAMKLPGLRHNGHRGYPAKKLVDFDIPGEWPYNYSIGEAQCALGISQLKRIDALTTRRRSYAKFIRDGVGEDLGITWQSTPLGSTHSYHLLVSQYHERDRLLERMHQQKVETVVQYLPLYKQPLFRDFSEAECANTDRFYAQAMSFPLYEWYERHHLEFLIRAIKKGITS